MKKGLILLSLIAMFVACGKKEEAPKAEVTTQSTVEQKAEETTPVVVENIEESVAADVTEATNGEIVTEVPVTEETVVIEEKVAQ